MVLPPEPRSRTARRQLVHITLTLAYRERLSRRWHRSQDHNGRQAGHRDRV